jgi:hypothetical protein
MDEIEENLENGEINREVDDDRGCLFAFFALVMICITVGFICWVLAWMRMHGG